MWLVNFCDGCQLLVLLLVVAVVLALLQTQRM